MNDDNMEKCCGVSTDFIKKLTDFFFIFIGEKASTNTPLSKMYRLRKIAKLKLIYGPMYLKLDDYPQYSDKRSDIFETHINRNLRCSYGYTNWVRLTDSITWVSIHSWEILLSEFSHAERIIACPRTIICNNCEQINMRGDILNAGENVDDQDIFGFAESYFKIAPTNIDDYTKNKSLNMQQENLRPQRHLDINDKRTDERYQKILLMTKNLLKEIR